MSRRIAFAILIVSLAAGCSQSTPPAKPSVATTPAGTPKLDTASRSEQTVMSTPTESSTTIQGVGAGINMTFTDPKTGNLLWTAKVTSIEAQSRVTANDVTGTMHGVDGILYKDGKPADHMTAKTVNVDNAHQTVVATGGVVVVSLTQVGTQLTCDSATYLAREGKLIGKGNVVFKKAGFTQSGPSFAADVKLKSVVMPAPGSASQSARPVTVQLTP